MCGLFGYVRKAGENREDERVIMLLKALAIADTTRGRDSTGLVTVDLQAKRARLVKKAVNGWNFIGKGFGNYIDGYPCDIAIGHNRAATSGQVNDRNSHPFGLLVVPSRQVDSSGEPEGVDTMVSKIGNLKESVMHAETLREKADVADPSIFPVRSFNEKETEIVFGRWDFGAHNGVFSPLVWKEMDVGDWEVDSEVVLTKIARELGQREPVSDVGAVIGEVLKTVSEKRLGNYAILYIDTKGGNLFGVRDDGRPLVLVETRSMGTWFCSTADIFENAWCMSRIVSRMPAMDREVISIKEIEPYSVVKVNENEVVRYPVFFQNEPIRSRFGFWRDEGDEPWTESYGFSGGWLLENVKGDYDGRRPLNVSEKMVPSRKASPKPWERATRVLWHPLGKGEGSGVLPKGKEKDKSKLFCPEPKGCQTKQKGQEKNLQKGNPSEDNLFFPKKKK